MERNTTANRGRGQNTTRSHPNPPSHPRSGRGRGPARHAGGNVPSGNHLNTHFLPTRPSLSQSAFRTPTPDVPSSETLALDSPKRSTPSVPSQTIPATPPAPSDSRQSLRLSPRSLDGRCRPPPLRRIHEQHAEKRWPHGVISTSAVFLLLEDLSRSPFTPHMQICHWLQAFIKTFGRIYTSDGLVIGSAEMTEILLYARVF